MSVASILAKCGLTAEKVRRAAIPRGVIAAENEAKYDGVKNLQDDFIARKFGGDIYGEIRSGTDNGNCSTRAGTYMKLKGKKVRI